MFFSRRLKLTKKCRRDLRGGNPRTDAVAFEEEADTIYLRRKRGETNANYMDGDPMEAEIRKSPRGKNATADRKSCGRSPKCNGSSYVCYRGGKKMKSYRKTKKRGKA